MLVGRQAGWVILILIVAPPSAVRSPCPNHRKPLARYGAVESALARGLLALCPQSQPTACRTRLQYNGAWSINPSIRANLKIAPALDRVSRSAKHRT